MAAAPSPLEPPGFAWRALRTAWLVARLRCPSCGLGRLSAGPFRLDARCGACGVAFERAPGEFTGGMGVSSVATCAGVGLLSFWVGSSGIPLSVGMPAVALFAVVFPIVFYRHSRALWIGVLHLAGLVHRDEAADPEPVIRAWPSGSEGGGPPPARRDSQAAPGVASARPRRAPDATASLVAREAGDAILLSLTARFQPHDGAAGKVAENPDTILARSPRRRTSRSSTWWRGRSSSWTRGRTAGQGTGSSSRCSPVGAAALAAPGGPSGRSRLRSTAPGA